ncbi:MAG TPA: redox-regulated ATPase YchF [Candidatus Acidoferrum sp.]|nr:redox-regulated ATPase YchF [Candidatus Acidoferrum sp.]
MLVGIVGAPNKGKSTLFSALTMNEVAIADYPFTTIKPNLGVAYATKKCVHEELGVKCTARNSLCVKGTRMLPINIVDVAGLVEGAHAGKGMGNQFLNDLASADALIMVVDASGKTDSAGNKTEGSNPINDVKIINEELVQWLAQIIKKHTNTISKRSDGAAALHEVLASMKATPSDIEKAANSAHLSTNRPNWSDSDIYLFAKELLKLTKPSIIAANKSDVEGSQKNIDSLIKEFGKEIVIPCSGAIELALRKATKINFIEYIPGSSTFSLLDKDLSDDRLNALKRMQDFLKQKGTNVQEIINTVTFKLLDNIVVYPVEDESKYTDHFGHVLPDAILVKRGSTASDLAAAIHTDLAKSMLYAVDARTKMRIAKDHILKDNDIIKIVSAAKPK